METRSHSTLFLLLPSPARQKMLRDENLSARETVRRIPATSVTLFREASVEDACDMEASSQKPPIDRMVHGNFAYRHPLPHVPRCLGHCANGLVREVVGRGRGRRWKHFLPSFSSSRLLLLPPSSPRLLPFRVPPLSPDVTSYFRVRPRLQVRPASFGSVRFVRVYLRRLDTASPFTSIRPSFRPTEYVAVEIPTRGLVLQGTFA